MATAEILSASVANGTISSWAFAGNLPSPAYVHATIAVDSRLYLVASAEGRTPTCAARSSVCAVVDGDTI